MVMKSLCKRVALLLVLCGGLVAGLVADEVIHPASLGQTASAGVLQKIGNDMAFVGVMTCVWLAGTAVVNLGGCALWGSLQQRQKETIKRWSRWIASGVASAYLVYGTSPQIAKILQFAGRSVSTAQVISEQAVPAPVV